MPQYVRSEAESQGLQTTIALRLEWQQFMHDNFFSDMTQRAYPSILPKVIPLELVVINGLFNPQAWEQYFYNEVEL